MIPESIRYCPFVVEPLAIGAGYNLRLPKLPEEDEAPLVGWISEEVAIFRPEIAKQAINQWYGKLAPLMYDRFQQKKAQAMIKAMEATRNNTSKQKATHNRRNV